ncbi:PepSY-associated TM helix domain-containing protein [Cognatilysobacter tabacisoli]|uniref:PepSY-associated TM helix domain-containing protein n=1 Tax=Cognatilysobacter tabacisoli TaxID=2315424 RepID=UPI000E6AE594|nr:PepSY-associated TM helix domain-containing protein [Lysobacter tabacisoli]
MIAKPTAPATAARRSPVQRWVRQLHLWIGAWGAIAAIVYGFTGLVMNHRFGDNAWPQGSNAPSGSLMLDVPANAQVTPEALTAWLSDTHGLATQRVRKSEAGGGALNGKPIAAREKWTLTGGTARQAWTLDYVPGNATAEVKQERHSALSAFNRLHKAYGGGGAWILLADSFAIGMLLLGLSGIWMWARGRTPKQLLLSVLAASVLTWVIVVGPSLA